MTATLRAPRATPLLYRYHTAEHTAEKQGPEWILIWNLKREHEFDRLTMWNTDLNTVIKLYFKKCRSVFYKDKALRQMMWRGRKCRDGKQGVSIITANSCHLTSSHSVTAFWLRQFSSFQGFSLRSRSEHLDCSKNDCWTAEVVGQTHLIIDAIVICGDSLKESTDTFSHHLVCWHKS